MHVYIVCVCLWLEVCKGCARVACLPVMFFVASSWRSNGTGWLCAQKEEERLRASIRRDNQKRRLKERAQHRGLSSSYLEGGYEDEEDDEDGLTSISAIKRNYKEKRDSEFWGRGEGGGGNFCYRIPKTIFFQELVIVWSAEKWCKDTIFYRPSSFPCNFCKCNSSGICIPSKF